MITFILDNTTGSGNSDYSRQSGNILDSQISAVKAIVDRLSENVVVVLIPLAGLLYPLGPKHLKTKAEFLQNGTVPLELAVVHSSKRLGSLIRVALARAFSISKSSLETQNRFQVWLALSNLNFTFDQTDLQIKDRRPPGTVIHVIVWPEGEEDSVATNLPLLRSLTTCPPGFDCLAPYYACDSCGWFVEATPGTTLAETLLAKGLVRHNFDGPASERKVEAAPNSEVRNPCVDAVRTSVSCGRQDLQI
eukprot:CAMPEP_0177594108 /NCGR_PEP_ID=MMETSP0419_2-20121207/9588_1 /TAXON_ID=582737 /ORGANISM="Tetraselmis sp., Strain GSL018" /LENGTH=248 /DNA_ID=CAMNT_0019085361 /DNA_START=352 /DNA_END=1095 /DNA_ORIENTATION=-